MSLVRYHTNDYSVPTEYGHRQVLIKGYVDKVVICAGSEEIARHRRSYGREELIFHPLHYLALLERKTGDKDRSANACVQLHRVHPSCITQNTPRMFYEMLAGGLVLLRHQRPQTAALWSIFAPALTEE